MMMMLMGRVIIASRKIAISCKSTSAMETIRPRNLGKQMMLTKSKQRNLTTKIKMMDKKI